MKQYQVPQFINVEDRIIGPFTLKQFFYLLGAGGVVIVGLVMFNVITFIILAAPLAMFFIALAFMKINNQPLPTIVANALAYYTRPRLYIWKHVEEKRKPEPSKVTVPPPSTSLGQAPPPQASAEGALSESRIADLAWSLDIKEHLERRYR